MGLTSTLRTISLFACVFALFACDSASGPDGGVGDGAIPTQDGETPTDSGAVDCSGRPADAPVTRSEVGMVHDAARDRLIIYGGNTAASERCGVPPSEIVAEMWAFHFDCGSWEQLTPAGGPGALARHAVVADTANERMLVFGGRASSSSYSNALWAFDLTTDTWSELATSGTAPPPVAEATANLDVERNRLLVFGGDPGGFTGSDGLYALDLEAMAWSRIDAADAPSPRLYHASAIVGDELLIFGGAAGFNPPYLNDVHAFDLTSETWRAVTTTGTGPNPRFGAELVPDEDSGRVLVMFGHDDTNLGNRNDMYALDLATSTWSNLHEGDTFNNPPTGMCEFPADFTTLEEGSPERRYSIGLAVSADGQAFIFGGKADCGYLNDVWRIDPATGDWASVRASTGGEVCLRTGRTDCGSLCF